MNISFYLVFIFILINNTSFSLINNNLPVNNNSNKKATIQTWNPYLNVIEDEWKLEKEIGGIRIESKIVKCINTNLGFDRELILLKFTNLTDKELQISYDLELFINNICITCDKMPEYHYQIKLNPTESIEGNCYNINLNHLKIFSHFLDSRFRSEKDEITSFNFEKVIVSEIKSLEK